MADKRIIEQNASTTVPDDAFFIFDSALLGTFKISQSALLDFFGNATITEVTKAQYDALPDTKLTDGVLYAIKDQETSYVVDIEVNGSSILDEDGIADLSVISKIEDEIANAIAEEYDSTHTYYNTGLVFHEGVLYQCTASSVTGTWDSTKWNAVDIKELLDNVSMNISYLWNVINNTIADNYDTSSTYDTGDYVIYSLKLYRCKADSVTGAWNSSKWDEVNIPEYIDYVLENAGIVKDVKVDGTSVVNEQGEAEIEIPVKDVQVKTSATYDSVVDASGNAKIDLSSVTAYGEVSNLPQAIASFNDGAVAPMKSLKVAIEPVQDLHGYDSPWVGGAGKNKFDYDTVYTSYKQSNGSFRLTANNAVGIKNYIPQDLLNKQLTFSVYVDLSKETSPNYIRTIAEVGGSLVSGTDVSSGNKGYISVTFTPTSTDDFFYFTYGSGGNNYFTMNDLMLEVSSTRTTFAPYENECPISGWSEANVSVTGKNLFGGSFNEYFPMHFNEDKVVIASADIPSESAYPVQIAFYDKNKTLLDYWGLSTQYSAINNRVARSFTLPKESYYLRYKTQSSANYQIEFGETNSAYTPYNGQTITIDLDGTRYGCTLDVISGELVVDRVGVDMGTLNWGKSSLEATILFVAISDRKEMSPMICSKYKYVRDKGFGLDFGTISDSSSSSYTNYIFVRNQDFSGKTATECASILNGTQLVYELATPLTIQLTPTQVKSLLGVNNIWADTGDINGCIYQRDINTTINDIIARIEALEG